jgi:hypothetical protein
VNNKGRGTDGQHSTSIDWLCHSTRSNVTSLLLLLLRLLLPWLKVAALEPQSTISSKAPHINQTTT